ncbi:TPR-like protein [Fragilariopsis cylindrus CCMP1102]|uniref:TPR-like protein n=1 Tax=Fragilariopsis cylindrus CCMP1102 TaxID=635003 RepID=A0A1E7FNN8_9STRA|nr:TPR-like protein [Fragilariopsis cylindrus CCMP1102]|eukprot:OEU19746.1 TPR-like protein [Fragilariopsis cylindrus CCMP1102]
MALNDTSNPDIISSTLYYNIGQTYTRQKLYNDASTWFHRSLAACNHPKDSSSLLALKTLHCLGYCNHRLGNDDKASMYYKRALLLVSEMDLGSSVHLAASLNCVGVLHFNSQINNNTELAMEMFRESLNIYRSMTNMNRSNKVAIATVLNNIGRVYYLQSKFQESLDVYEESLRSRREILGSDSVDVAATVYNIGQTCHQIGRLDESLSYYKEFLRIASSVMPMDSGSKDMALVLKGIAEIYQEKSDLNMALFYFSRALELQKNFDNIYSTDVATTLNKLGNICYEMKNFTTAMSHYKKGLEIERKVLPANHPHTIITLVNIAHIHKQLGEHENALTAYMAACKMQMTAFGRESLSVAETLSSIGLMQYHIHFFDLAKKCFGESLRIRSKILGRDHRDVAILWYNIATIHFETGEDDIAVEMYKETLRVERKALGDDHPDVVLTLQHLGQVHQQMGQINEALRYFNEALNIELKLSRNRTQDSNKSGSMARLLNLLGNVYLQLGKTVDMMKCYAEASRIYEANQRPGETLVIAGYNFYGLSKTNPSCAAVA